MDERGCKVVVVSDDGVGEGDIDDVWSPLVGTVGGLKPVGDEVSGDGVGDDGETGSMVLGD